MSIVLTTFEHPPWSSNGGSAMHSTSGLYFLTYTLSPPFLPGMRGSDARQLFKSPRTKECADRGALQVSGKPDTLRTYMRKSAAKWSINLSPSIPQHASIQ